MSITHSFSNDIHTSDMTLKEKMDVVEESNIKISKEFPIVLKSYNLEPISTRLEVPYHNDANIIGIHEHISKNFAIQRSKVEDLTAMANARILRSKSADLTVNQSRNLIKESKDIMTKVKEYSSDDSWNKYIEKAEPLLIEYSCYMSEGIKGIVCLGRSKKKERPEVIKTRIDIIEKYLFHLKNFIQVDLTRQENSKHRCPVCNIIYNEDYVIEEVNRYTCVCGYSYYLMSKEISYHDPYQIGNSPPIEENGLMDNINRFCGKKNNVIIPQLLYAQFDEYLERRGCKIGSYYKNLPKESIKDKERINNTHGTSVAMLLTMLKETNNSFYYDDVNHIGHEYFGWILPDLSKYIGIIMSVNDITKSVYDKMPFKRISILNGNVILYFTLKFLKIPVSSEDFKLMDTKESFDSYKDTWKKITSDNLMLETRDKFFKENGIKEYTQSDIII